MQPPIHRIDPRAARYLELLVEFGHLDAVGAEEVLFAACEAFADPDRPVPLVAVQRLAAARLLRWDAPTPEGADILSADWPLLFH